MVTFPFFSMPMILLFMEHDFEKASNLKLILSAFEQLCGLKINFHKSELFYFSEANDNSNPQYAGIFLLWDWSVLY
jgi:hypothetical protein